MSISVFSAVGGPLFRRRLCPSHCEAHWRHWADIWSPKNAEVKQGWTFSPLTCLTLSYTVQVALIKISWVVHYSLAAVRLQIPSFPANEQLLIGYVSFDMVCWKFILLLDWLQTYFFRTSSFCPLATYSSCLITFLFLCVETELPTQNPIYGLWTSQQTS